jgi:anti-anti-sigma factor
MEIAATDLSDRVTKVALTGRLDTAGVDRVETKFLAICAAAGSHALVDLSGVTFMASMGIRMLIAPLARWPRAKPSSCCSAPQPMVSDVLNHTALADVIPIAADEKPRSRWSSSDAPLLEAPSLETQLRSPCAASWRKLAALA